MPTSHMTAGSSSRKSVLLNSRISKRFLGVGRVSGTPGVARAVSAQLDEQSVRSSDSESNANEQRDSPVDQPNDPMDEDQPNDPMDDEPIFEAESYEIGQGPPPSDFRTNHQKCTFSPWLYPLSPFIRRKEKKRER
ncbi:hypothetical protein WR25_04199 [Diploscapter pachys]|uniref:Uncharacterized protein n=1 Tax=Diploscapter pachys TaxID=2018661 RepID=A0A2A2KHR8_9BILA|nr:hypothetical protein WR25_04199 [Diploscapter pachys]